VWTKNSIAQIYIPDYACGSAIDSQQFHAPQPAKLAQLQQVKSRGGR